MTRNEVENIEYEKDCPTCLSIGCKYCKIDNEARYCYYCKKKTKTLEGDCMRCDFSKTTPNHLHK